MIKMDNAEQLQSLVNDQLVVGFACLTPKGNIHGSPVWITTNGESIFFYSKEERKKIQYLKTNPVCTVIFKNGTVKGEAEIVNKNDQRFRDNYKYLDPRYDHDKNYEMYKNNWNVMVLIKPLRIY